MSSNLDVLALTDDDAMKLLVCESHIGTKSLNFQMEHYMFKRRPDGIHIINIRAIWEKLLLAARAIAAIDNPADVVVVSAVPHAQRALLKFAVHIGATPVVGRFTPGSLTNQIQKNFKEPRMLIVSDPVVDHQALTEASYVNTPVVAFCNMDSPVRFVDIAIPCNNKNKHSIGLMWWLLAREVLHLRGKITRQNFMVDGKVIMPDLYFYRDPEAEKEAAVEAEPEQKESAWGAPVGIEAEYGAVPTEPVKLDFNVEHIQDWAAASEWGQQEQPAAAMPAPIAAPTQPAQQQHEPKQDEWGSGGTSGW